MFSLNVYQDFGESPPEKSLDIARILVNRELGFRKNLFPCFRQMRAEWASSAVTDGRPPTSYGMLTIAGECERRLTESLCHPGREVST